MAREPKAIVEVHELMKRLQKREEVSREEVRYHLRKALERPSSAGTWIRREVNDGERSSSLAVIQVESRKGLVGLRLSAHA